MELKEPLFENPDEGKEIEKEEKYGEDVHEIITCMRHGPRGKGGGLAEGAEEVIQKSIGDFDLARDGIKVFTSESKPERCQETGRIISRFLDDYKREHRQVRPLTSSLEGKDKELIIKIENTLLPENYENISLDEKKKISQQIENKEFAYFLDNNFSELVEQLEKERKGTFPSKEMEMSSLENAARFAEWIKLCVKASKWLLSNIDINLINVSHSFNLMAFLKEAMIFKKQEKKIKARDLKGEEFLEKIGGTIKPAEFFNIDVRRQDQENFEVFLKFRDKDYDLDFSRIEELAKLSKQMRERKKRLTEDNKKTTKD